MPIDGSERVIPCDTVVVAVGTRQPAAHVVVADLALTERGYLAADEHGMTNLPGVFAGGDIVRGSATVILAMGDGKRIAGAIDDYLRGPASNSVAPPCECSVGSKASELDQLASGAMPRSVAATRRARRRRSRSGPGGR